MIPLQAHKAGIASGIDREEWKNAGKLLVPVKPRRKTRSPVESWLLTLDYARFVCSAAMPVRLCAEGVRSAFPATRNCN